MKYEFLVESYQTERVKVLSVWSEFKDDDLPVRPNPNDPRGRSVHEHMVHQCVSEDVWFRTMLGVDVGASALPEQERRLAFIRQYAEDSREAGSERIGGSGCALATLLPSPRMDGGLGRHSRRRHHC